MKTTVNGSELEVIEYTGSLKDPKADMVVIGIFEKGSAIKYKSIDDALRGEISRSIKEDGFEGKLKQAALIKTLGLIPPKAVLCVGLGKEEEISLEKIRKASAVCISVAKK